MGLCDAVLAKVLSGNRFSFWLYLSKMAWFSGAVENGFYAAAFRFMLDKSFVGKN